MKRRQFSNTFAFASLSCLVGGHALAQSQAAPKKDNSTHPFRTVNVPEDGRRVLFFFDFACPFCANYHDPLWNFASTVPKGIQTMFVPVVNVADLARKQEQMIAAKCYYSASEVASKAQIARFSASIYDSYQQTHSLMDKEMWTKAVKVSGINMNKFVAAMKSDNSNFQIQYAARKTTQYALRATPSVGIGGKYVLTPDDVLGDQSMFFNILNGLTSEIL